MNSKCDIQNMTGHMQPKTIIQTGFEIFLGLSTVALINMFHYKNSLERRKGAIKTLK